MHNISKKLNHKNKKDRKIQIFATFEFIFLSLKWTNPSIQHLFIFIKYVWKEVILSDALMISFSILLEKHFSNYIEKLLQLKKLSQMFQRFRS